MNRSTLSVPRPFDDERKTQDIVFRVRGTFRTFRHDKARSKAGLEGPVATEIALACGLGESFACRHGRTRPVAQF